MPFGFLFVGTFIKCSLFQENRLSISRMCRTYLVLPIDMLVNSAVKKQRGGGQTVPLPQGRGRERAHRAGSAVVLLKAKRR